MRVVPPPPLIFTHRSKGSMHERINAAFRGIAFSRQRRTFYVLLTRRRTSSAMHPLVFELFDSEAKGPCACPCPSPPGGKTDGGEHKMFSPPLRGAGIKENIKCS